jgi:hypothetical protein
MPSVQVLDFEDIGHFIHITASYAISVCLVSVLPAASFRCHLTAETLPSG